jgi:hypothetical protein
MGSCSVFAEEDVGSRPVGTKEDERWIKSIAINVEISSITGIIILV